MTAQKRMTPEIPANYAPLERQSTFSKRLGTFYMPAEQKKGDSAIYLGMVLEACHEGGPERGHGGVALALLDEAMGRAAAWSTDKLCLTASFTSHFCASSRIGNFIYAKAIVRKRGVSLVFVDAELFDQNEKLLSTATGTWSVTKADIPSI